MNETDKLQLTLLVIAIIVAILLILKFFVFGRKNGSTAVITPPPPSTPAVVVAQTVTPVTPNTPAIPAVANTTPPNTTVRVMNVVKIIFSTAAVICIIALLYIYIPPLKLRADRWAENYQPEANTLPPIKLTPMERLDRFVGHASPSRGDDLVEVVKGRLWRAYGIPQAEIAEELKNTRGIPNSDFMRNITLRYQLKDIPTDPRELPSTVDGVRMDVKDASGTMVPNTCVHIVKIQKGRPSRYVSIDGWSGQPHVVGGGPDEFTLVCDPPPHAGSAQTRTVQFKRGRYYEVEGGKWVQQVEGYDPKMFAGFVLQLRDTYPHPTATVRIEMKRTRAPL